MAEVLREDPVGSAWFAHFDHADAVAHVDVRGPTYKGSLTGGVKSLFRLPLKGPPLPRLVVTEAAIDALSLAAIENLRGDTLYAATGGGMGTGTIAALEALLVDITRLAVGLWRVWPGSPVFDAKAAQGFGVAARSEGGAIVGHDALDRDAVLVEEPKALNRKRRQEPRFSSGRICE